MLTRNSWKRVSDTVRSRDGETCQYCGNAAPDGAPDHILPLERGGRDSLDNLVWCCKSCNRKKQSRTLREWIIHIRSDYTEPIPRTQGKRGKLELAVQWLTEIFSQQSEISTSEVYTRGAAMGFGEAILDKAKRKVKDGGFKLVSVRRSHGWVWRRNNQ